MTPFSFSNRRHHCRACLRLVCAACSSRSLVLASAERPRMLSTVTSAIHDIAAAAAAAAAEDAPAARGAEGQRVCDDCWASHAHAADAPGGADDAPEAESEDVEIEVFVVQAQRLSLSKDSGMFAGETRRQPNAYAEVSFEGRVFGATRPVAEAGAPTWGESFSLRVQPTCRRAACYVVVEVFDARRPGSGRVATTSTGDDVIGRCRAPFFGGDGSDGAHWHDLLDAAGGAAGRVQLRCRARAGRIEAPLWRGVLPFAAPPYDAAAGPSAVAPWPARLDALYPRGSPLFDALFESFVDDDDDAVGAAPALGAVPACEFILEAFAQTETARPDDRCAAMAGMLFVTTHRLLFVPYASKAVVSVAHASVLEANVRPANLGRDRAAAHQARGTLALDVICRDFSVHCFWSHSATNRELSWCKQEVAWRTREDAFHHRSAARGGDDEGEAPPEPGLGVPGVAETPLQLALDDAADDGAGAAPGASLTKRQQRRRALRSFLTMSSRATAAAAPAGGAAAASPRCRSAADVDLVAEFRRQGVLDDARWRVSDANARYDLCPTYPAIVVVPRAVTDAAVFAAAKWRSKGRIPVATRVMVGNRAVQESGAAPQRPANRPARRRSQVLTYYNRRTGAPLCRASQPLVGLGGGACPEDEALLLHIRAACARSASARQVRRCASDESFSDFEGDFDGESDSDGGRGGRAAAGNGPRGAPVLRICDARPLIHAKANAAMGRGHEVLSRLGGKGCASLEFLDIPNVHVVQSSFRMLREALQAPGDDESVPRGVHESRWLQHAASLLRGAARVAKHSEAGDAVLVHCSDGWDRTAQICALAQFMLDPFFRTIDGFCVLLEKDFCSFGHRFLQRGGFGDDGEVGPIFLQFLDAVAQLLRQFPRETEFNESLLDLLGRHAYARSCGNFLADSDRDRATNARSRRGQGAPVSLWRIVRHGSLRFTNTLYHARGGAGADAAYRPLTVLHPDVYLQACTLSTAYLPHALRPKAETMLHDTVSRLEAHLRAARDTIEALEGRRDGTVAAERFEAN